MAGDRIEVPVWLMPKRGELEKVIQRGVKIPAVISQPFQHYGASGEGSVKGGMKSIARGVGEGERKLSWFEKKTIAWQKEAKILSLATKATLLGIAVSLTQVPSILKGSLKMLSFGFLLILKPLADLLAMALLPLAGIVIQIATWMNKVAGGSFAGMITMAAVGLIVAVIAGLALSVGIAAVGSALTSLIVTTIGSAIGIPLTGPAIATALTTLSVTAIGATTLAGLIGVVLIAGALTTLITSALGATPTESILLGLGSAILAGVAIILGVPFWTALAVAVIAGIAVFAIGENAKSGYEAAKSGKTQMSTGSIFGPLGDLPYNVGLGVSGMEDLISGKPSQSSAPVINVTVNGTIVDKRSFMDDLMNTIKSATQTNNARAW
jgi:hypothetical protein